MHTEVWLVQRRRMTQAQEPIARAVTAADIRYVRSHYVTLDQLARGVGEADWPGARLPRATYQLADGTLWYPRDWWRLHDEAGGVAELPAMFARRLRAAAAARGHVCDAGAEWDAYLAGLYGACLREVTPEGIVEKDWLVTRLDRALAEPRPDDADWQAALRADVAALDRISRPFADCDRLRFGRPTSRDRLIEGARHRHPQVFVASAARPDPPVAG